MGLADAELGDELVRGAGVEDMAVTEVKLFGGWSKSLYIDCAAYLILFLQLCTGHLC